MYGPTAGDAVRLADTSLLAEVELDHAVPAMNACTAAARPCGTGWGYARLRQRHGCAGHAAVQRAGHRSCPRDRQGRHRHQGRPNRQHRQGRKPGYDGWGRCQSGCGAATTVRDAEGMIATPGGIDVHVHFDSAQLCEHAISTGITTMIGGSLGPITVGIDCGGRVECRQDAASRRAVADQLRLPGPRQLIEAALALRSDRRWLLRAQDP